MTAYVTLSEATTYFGERLENAVWNESEDTLRTRALKTATRLIDRLSFAGDKTEDDQDNEFPRNDETEVYQDIKDACCEIAYELLDGRDPMLEGEFMNIESSNMQSVKMSRMNEVPIHIRHNIPSAIAWSYLRPYLTSARAFQIERID